MNKDEKIKAYMCKTDFDYHIPDDINGVDIYFSKQDLINNRPCVKDCGIVEIEVSFSKVINKAEPISLWITDDE